MFWTQKNLKILSLIGEGLNANVYKVLKRQPDINVSKIFALKVLKRSKDLNHFKTEFESLLKADGKHIVKYRGWETYKSKPALLLEYIDGVTLHTLLSHTSLNNDEATWIHKETHLGLKELCDSGLFHGDLSPKNIMITLNGDIKLIDFGLTHWRTKKIELTPEFAAPAVLSGAKPSLESDLISLNRIFLQFDLNQENKEASHLKPTSLSQKIKNIQSLQSHQTQALPAGTKNANQSISIKWLRNSLFILTGLCVVSPVTAQNNTLLEHELVIRSSNWLAVKTTSDSPWCFTPCSLKFNRTGLHSIYWKNDTKTEKANIYIDGNTKTLLLSTLSTHR